MMVGIFREGRAAGMGFGDALKYVGVSASIAQIAITALVAAVAIGIAAYEQWKQSEEEARQKSIEYANQATEEVNTLRNLYNEYDRLGSISNRTTSEEEEFKDIQSQIIPLLGERTTALEGLTQGTNDYADALKSLTIDEMEEKLRLLREGLVATEGELEAYADNGLFGLGQKGILFPAAYDMDPNSIYGQINQRMSEYVDDGGGGIPVISMPKDADLQLEFYAALSESLDLLYQESERLRQLGDIAGAEAIIESKFYTDLSGFQKNMNDLVTSVIEYKTQIAELEYIRTNGVPETEEELSATRDAIWSNIGINDEFKDQVYQTINEMHPALAVVATTIGEAIAGSSTYVIEETERLGAVVSEAYNEITKLHSGYDILMQAADEFATTGALTAETMNSLASNGLLQYLTMVGDELVFNADALIADEEAARRNAEMTLKAGLAKDLYALATTGASDAEYYAAAGANSAAEGAAVMGQEFANSINGIVNAEVALRAFFATAAGKELSANAFAGKGRQVQQLVDTYNGAFSALQNIQSISSRDPFQGATRGAGSNAAATREATEAQREYREELEDQEDAINGLLEMTIKMIKKEKQLQKEALQDELDGYKKIIDARKELLRLREEEYDYQKELAEANKEVSDIESELLSIQFDDSEAAQRRRLELQEQLTGATNSLNELLYDREIELSEDALDTEYERFEELQKAKIEAIEQYLDMEGQIRQDAIALIEARTQEFYNRLLHWNELFNTGIDQDVVNAWNNAYNAMMVYNGGAIQVLSTLAQITARMKELEIAAKNAAIAQGGVKTGTGNTNINTTSQPVRWGIFDPSENLIEGNFDSYASAYKKMNSNYMYVADRVHKYSRGLKRSNKNHLGAMDEPWIGDEMFIKTANGSRLKRIEVGDSILPANFTKTLTSFAKNPLDFIKNALMGNISSVVNNNASQPMTIDARLIVQGNVTEDALPKLQAMMAQQKNSIFKEMLGNINLAGYRKSVVGT